MCGSLIGIISGKKHLLTFLLFLEIAAFSLFVGAVDGFGMLGSYEVCLIVISVSACEAAVGLGLLISLVRVKGNDFTRTGLLIKL